MGKGKGMRLLGMGHPTLPDVPKPGQTVREQMLTRMIERMSLKSGIRNPLEGHRPWDAAETFGGDGSDWRVWLTDYFPGYFTADFAPHHEEFWTHVWSIKPEIRPKPLIAVFARGGGKSSSVETAAVALGVHGERKYAIYVSATQDQADKHVESVGSLLEASSAFAARYPGFANRLIGKYGHSKGWRRSRLTTQSGYTIDAAGLDKGVRGIKREGVRPDVIILDDLDDVLDGPITITRKLMILVRSILPSGSSDVAIIGVQNLIHPDSIFSRLIDGRADFLMDRHVIGPIPAIEGLTYELQQGRYVITGGRATWAGQSIETCQALMNDGGLTSFLNEAQHDVDTSEAGMYHHIEFQHCDWDEVPELLRVAVWVDPAVTQSDRSDSHGVQADGLGMDGKIYRLFSWEQRASPEAALRVAILKAIELRADSVGVETDQGGDTWMSTFYRVVKDLEVEEGISAASIRFKWDKAGSGHGPKTHRQAQMLTDYERGKIVHVRGTHPVLERALKRFGVRKPFDLADACIIEGTRIQTSHGLVPIESVTPGMLALTRYGYCPVLAAGMTQESAQLYALELDDDRVLIGTGNHPIYVEEKLWTRLDSLCCGDILLLCQDETALPSMGSPTIAIPTPSNEPIASTIPQGNMAACIEPSGLMPMDRSQPMPAMRSTTSMRTPLTMPWTISNFFRSASTNTSMITRRRLRFFNTLTEFASMRPSGMPPKMASNGTVNMDVKIGRINQPERFSVPYADTGLKRDTKGMIQPVVRTDDVAWNRGNVKARREKRVCVTGVPRPSPQSNVMISGIATSTVRRVQRAGAAPVFNLMVAEHPEYFANGILVHNCYWSWYDLSSQIPVPSAPVLVTQQSLWIR